MIIYIKIGEKGRFAKLIAPGRKRKYWEMERDAQEKNLLAVEKEAKEKDKIIDDLSKQIRKFEEEKLDYHESQDKLAKLYTLGRIDSNGDPLEFNPEDFANMK